jgi:hypothetical protein
MMPPDFQAMQPQFITNEPYCLGFCISLAQKMLDFDAGHKLALFMVA